MNYEEYTLSFQEILLYSGQGSAVCALISYTFTEAGWCFSSFACRAFLSGYSPEGAEGKTLFRLNQEFKEGILILAANLSAGYSIENALVNSGQELDMLYGKEGMINAEFLGMSRQIQMNRTVEQVFLNLHSAAD